MTPHRIQLSRSKGWRMPAGAVKVDRSTSLGNPFIAGRHGTAAECVHRFANLCLGLYTIGPGAVPPVEEQAACFNRIWAALPGLKGLPLACWCKPDAPCHADVLLELANAEVPDLTRFNPGQGREV